MTNTGSFFKAMPPVTKNLIIINVIVWLAMMLLPSNVDANMMKYGALHFYGSSEFNPVQLVSYMFIHSTQSVFHLFFNMFTLFMFGITLERVMGSKRFIIFYMVCGVGAALIQEAVWAVTLPDLVYNELARLNLTTAEAMKQYMTIYPDVMEQNLSVFTTVGASGAIYGILLAFGMLFPNRPLYFMFLPVPIKAKWMVLIWGGLEILLGISSATDGVAHFAHLGGMIFGFMLMIYWMKKGEVYGDRY